MGFQIRQDKKRAPLERSSYDLDTVDDIVIESDDVQRASCFVFRDDPGGTDIARHIRPAKGVDVDAIAWLERGANCVDRASARRLLPPGAAFRSCLR
jgi:hypothetical protein